MKTYFEIFQPLTVTKCDPKHICNIAAWWQTNLMKSFLSQKESVNN